MDLLDRSGLRNNHLVNAVMPKPYNKFRNRYNYHKILIGVEGFNIKERTFSAPEVEKYTDKQKEAVKALVNKYGYSLQNKLL